jgi:outer membrane protein TolC
MQTLKLNHLYRRKIFSIILALELLILTSSSKSEQAIVLTLEESIDIALEKSIDIQVLWQSMHIAECHLWAAKAGYRTRVESQFYTPMYDEGFQLIEIVDGNPVPKRYGSYKMQGVMDIVQPLPWIPFGGGDLTFRSTAYQLNSWTPSTINPDTDLKSAKFYTSLSLIINKPLFTINNLRLSLRRAKFSYEKQSYSFKRSELDLIYQVTSAFYGLYSQLQRHEIDKEKVERQEEIFNTTTNKFKAGLIAEVDAMQAEVELIQCRNDFKKSESALFEQEAAFKQLIGLNLEDPIKLVTELELKRMSVDIDRAIQIGLQNRSEIIEKKIAIEEQYISIKQTEARVSVKGNLRGYYDLSGFSDSDLAWGTTTEDLFYSSWNQLKQTPNRGFTFELKVPLWDWGKNRAEVEAAKASLRQQELGFDELKMNIEREIRDVVRNVDQTWDRLQMLAISKKVSEKSFEISIHRFNNGEITSIELSRANEQLNEAKLSYLSAYIEYKLAIADLKRKTLYDFENDKSLVE